MPYTSPFVFPTSKNYGNRTVIQVGTDGISTDYQRSDRNLLANIVQATGAADFSYVIDKVRDVSFTEQPFKYIEIKDLFKASDFQQIVDSPENRIDKAYD